MQLLTGLDSTFAKYFSRDAADCLEPLSVENVHGDPKFAMHYIYRYLILVLWVVWVLYWKLAAINVKLTTRRESIRSRITHIAPLVAAFLLLSWPDEWGSILFQTFLPQSYLTFWTGTALVVMGLGFTVWARLVLGRNWSGTVTIKKDHELVQAGPYRWVRHPIYTGLLLAFFGTALALGEWRGLLACCLALAAFVIKLRIEERWMTELFGPAYLHYQKRVRRLVPLVW